jgi:hypothetical protein
MNAGTMSATSKGAGMALLACGAAFVLMFLNNASVSQLMAPVYAGWLALLIAVRHHLTREKHSALYFAFSVLALMIFFIHETYGYEGRVRNFPLIVGYIATVICLLDILSLTETRAGAAITIFFGSHLDESEIGGRKVMRELIAFAAMGGCVLGIWLFGFLVFSPIFVIAWMLAGGKTVKSSLYCGGFTLAFIYLMFELAFAYELFRGVVFIWLLDL